MTVVWLIGWLTSSTPPVEPWNSWLIALLVCAFADWLGVV